MTSDRSPFDDSPVALPAPIGEVVVRPGVCRICGAAAALPVGARFCPRCGATLRADADGRSDADAVERFVAIREAERALPPLARLAADDDDAPRDPSTPPPLPPPFLRSCDFHSDVLIAYASALFRLGWRYERGHGAHRNPAEAIRCYCKSARLGNSAAAARLSESAGAR